MSTIGLDNLVYAPITNNEDGNEEYGTPVSLAKAIKADISVENAEAILYADDGAAEDVKMFKGGKVSIGVDDIGTEKAKELTGAEIDKNGVLVSTDTDIAPYVALGFRALKPNGKYRYFWLYKVKFAVPSINLATKGDSISFQTPTIEGSIMRRNKPDAKNKHPWKAEVTEGDTGINESVLTDWFKNVYEPSFETASGESET